jgi:hypothetical protein
VTRSTKVQGAGSNGPRAGGFLRFHLPDALHEETTRVLGEVEAAADPTEHGAALAKVVLALTECGLDYYFLGALRAAKAGLLAEQSAKMGIATFLRVMGPLSRRILIGMSAAQLRVVAAHMRALMT